MNMKISLTILVIAMVLTMLFKSMELKKKKMTSSMSTFECGFNSNFMSRFSFSIQYFMVGLIFLFLDLELSMIMPYFSSEFPSVEMKKAMMMFLVYLTSVLAVEWMEGKLEWKS